MGIFVAVQEDSTHVRALQSVYQWEGMERDWG